VRTEKTRVREREYHLCRYHARRAAAIIQLGGQCVRCDSVEELQFDHIDPEQKLFALSKAGVSEVSFQVELEKCQLLCGKCHCRKTRDQDHPLTKWNFERVLKIKVLLSSG